MKVKHCESCDGKGKRKMFPGSGVTISCPECDGTGHIITK